MQKEILLQKLLEHEIRARSDFNYFVDTIFADAVRLSGLAGTGSDGRKGYLVTGDYTREIAEFLQGNPWTMRVSARDHFKSFSFYAHFMWRLYQARKTNLECLYFSYKEELAGYHIAKIKQIISASPAFEQAIDHKKRAESVISYQWWTKPSEKSFSVTMEPGGLLSFKRGQHPNGPLYIDDPLRDPENKLDPTSIKRINKVFRYEVLPMPQNELHVVGTVQTDQDFFFDSKLKLQDDEEWSRDRRKFRVKIQPAIISFTDKKVLFPEWKSFTELQNIRIRDGEKAFNQEYQCIPAYAEDSYLPQSIKSDPEIVIPGWQGVNPLSYTTEGSCEAGFDIGKMSHPSHIAVWESTGQTQEVDNNGIKMRMPKRRLVFQKFLDGWDYNKQVDYMRDLIRQLKIDRVYYDNTRGELAGFDEMGIVPRQMVGVSFNNKTKSAMASVLFKEITQKRFELIDDTRFINQTLAVNNDLQAVETPDGHGDAFWSLALSLFTLTKKEPRIRSLDD